MRIEQDWYRMTGTPIKLSRTPGSLRSLPPKFGQHSREILAEFGFSDAEVADLIAENTVLEKRQ